jgi:hypothetical protein
MMNTVYRIASCASVGHLLLAGSREQDRSEDFVRPRPLLTIIHPAIELDKFQY